MNDKINCDREQPISEQPGANIDAIMAGISETLKNLGFGKENDIQYDLTRNFLENINLNDELGGGSYLKETLNNLDIFDAVDVKLILFSSKDMPMKAKNSRTFNLSSDVKISGSQVAVCNILECIDEFGKENVRKLHDELGIINFSVYDRKILKRMIKVINKDPEELKRLSYGGATLIVSSSMDHDGIGTAPSTLERIPYSINGSAEADYNESGFSVICETAFEKHDDNNPDSEDLQLDKQATFLTHMVEFMKERNIPIHNIFLNSHGVSKHKDQDGIYKALYGTTRVVTRDAFDNLQDQSWFISYGSKGFRDLIRSVSDGGRIINGACYGAEIDHETGYSAIGDLANIAYEERGKNDIVVYGTHKARSMAASHEADRIDDATGQAITDPFGINIDDIRIISSKNYGYDKDGSFYPATTTQAFVDDDGNVITTETEGVQFKVNIDRKNWRNTP